MKKHAYYYILEWWVSEGAKRPSVPTEGRCVKGEKGREMKIETVIEETMLFKMRSRRRLYLEK